MSHQPIDIGIEEKTVWKLLQAFPAFWLTAIPCI